MTRMWQPRAAVVAHICARRLQFRPRDDPGGHRSRNCIHLSLGPEALVHHSETAEHLSFGVVGHLRELGDRTVRSQPNESLKFVG